MKASDPSIFLSYFFAGTYLLSFDVVDSNWPSCSKLDQQPREKFKVSFSPMAISPSNDDAGCNSICFHPMGVCIEKEPKYDLKRIVLCGPTCPKDL